MCMEDVVIERKIKTQMWFAASGNGRVTQRIPARATRLGIRLCGASGAIVTLESQQEYNGAAGAGGNNWIIGTYQNSVGVSSASTSPTDCNLLNCGEIIKGDLILAAGQATGFAIETYLDVEEVSAVHYDKLPAHPQVHDK